MDRTATLDRAKEAVASRPNQYGAPEDNFKRIAAHWNTHINNTHAGEKPRVNFFTATDVAIMLGLVKVARLENDPTHADSWIDLAGYAGCGAEVSQSEIPDTPKPGSCIPIDYEVFRQALRDGKPTIMFGFTVGERVNLYVSQKGSIPGTVVGFHCQHICVKWDNINRISCWDKHELRHGE